MGSTHAADDHARLPVLRPVSIALMLGALALGWHPSARGEAAAPVTSLLEQRQQQVVAQQWDLSCGAAALATVLRYQHGDPVTEREVAERLMSRSEYLANPQLVTYRQGFSLLDLKRFADQRGYRGVGLGRMTFGALQERAPAIVAINEHGYQHFVVFRGLLDDRVLLADPAFGNRTLTRGQFEAAWLTFGELGRVAFVVERRDGLIPPNRLGPHRDLFLTLN